MAKRVAKDMFPSVIGEGTLVPNELPGDRPAVPSCRQLRKKGSLSPPPPWPPFLGTVYCHYVIIVWCRHNLHRWPLPP